MAEKIEATRHQLNFSSFLCTEMPVLGAHPRLSARISVLTTWDGLRVRGSALHDDFRPAPSRDTQCLSSRELPG